MLKKEQECKTLLKRPTSSRAASVVAGSPRLSADWASGMDPRLAKKKDKSLQRAEQHRGASAQGALNLGESMRPTTLRISTTMNSLLPRVLADFVLGMTKVMKEV